MKCEPWKYKAINAKPCPFCGSTSVSVAHREERFIGQNNAGIKKIKMAAYCICNKCHSRSKPVIYIGYTRYTDYIKDYRPVYSCGDEAVEKWNRRVGEWKD